MRSIQKNLTFDPIKTCRLLFFSLFYYANQTCEIQNNCILRMTSHHASILVYARIKVLSCFTLTFLDNRLNFMVWHRMFLMLRNFVWRCKVAIFQSISENLCYITSPLAGRSFLGFHFSFLIFDQFYYLNILLLLLLRKTSLVPRIKIRVFSQDLIFRYICRSFDFLNLHI